MEDFISFYEKIRPSTWGRTQREQDEEGSRQLKRSIDASPYVINILEGSIASLTHVAMIEEQEGTDILVVRMTQDRREGSVISQLLREGLSSTTTPLILANSKKDKLHVTLSDAVRFFNSYEIVGVDINKVSTGGNSRGFYRVEALKVIAKGLGLKVEGTAKGAFVDAVHSWHTQNEEIIKKDREETRSRVTLREEMDDGASR